MVPKTTEYWNGAWIYFAERGTASESSGVVVPAVDHDRYAEIIEDVRLDRTGTDKIADRPTNLVDVTPGMSDDDGTLLGIESVRFLAQPRNHLPSSRTPCGSTAITHRY